jgi:hypothetical protein
MNGIPPYTYTWYLNGKEAATTTSPEYTYTLTNMGQNLLNVTITDSTGYTVYAYLTVNFTYNCFNIIVIAVIIIALVSSIALIFRSKGHKKGPGISQQPPPPPG